MKTALILTILTIIVTALWACGGGGTQQPPPSSSSATISIDTERGPLTLTSWDSAGGAIASMRWGGCEFIDTNDHGRLLQSAVQLDDMGERQNPTEGGASIDGPASRAGTSVMLGRQVLNQRMIVATQMAYWNRYQGAALSTMVVHKDVQLGYAGDPHAVRYLVTIDMPTGELHTLAQFETLTQYMPPALSRMFTLDTSTGTMIEEFLGLNAWRMQPLPLIFATSDLSCAVGVRATSFAPSMGYGYWHYDGSVVKWDLNTRIANPIAGNSYQFEHVLGVGTIDQVRAVLLRP